MRSTHLAGCALAAGLVLAGCSGGETTISAPESIDEPANPSSTTGSTADDSTSPNSTSANEASTDEAGTDEAGTDEPRVSIDPAEAAEIASANAEAIESTDDGRTTEILSISDGSITTLQQAVTGDRPVLLWFWAPH